MATQKTAARSYDDERPHEGLFDSLGRLYEYVLVMDRVGRVVWCSDPLEALLPGLSLVGTKARELVSGIPHPEQALAARSELLRAGHVTNARFDLDCEGKRAIPVECTVFPMERGEDEEPLFVAISRPTGEREKAEAAAARDPGVADSILGATRDGVLVIDERGFIRYANPAVERFVGRSPESLLQSPIAALVHYARDMDDLVESLAPDEEVCDVDFALRHARGEAMPVWASVSPLHRGETHGGTILFLRDPRRRRDADGELARQNAELEHCVQTLAHDLRSPLVALLGFSRLLRQDFEDRLDETGSHFLDRIEQAGRTMESLIHDVLELSRIGQCGERRSLVDPRSILLQIQAELKPRLDTGHIRLALPENPPLVYCDRTRLYQVFSNLLGNAVEHMGPCDSPQVDVEIAQHEEETCIVVRDRGRGIAPEHHEQIFEVFQSLSTRADGRRGTGIGLAIVKKIAETHDGRVWVESAPGAGAAFHVALPRR